jgi:hypothetical protein
MGFAQRPSPQLFFPVRLIIAAARAIPIQRLNDNKDAGRDPTRHSVPQRFRVLTLTGALVAAGVASHPRRQSPTSTRDGLFVPNTGMATR